VIQVEGERVLAADVEVHLWLDVDVLPPRLLQVPVPATHLIVTVVDGASDRRKRRVQLDGGIA
jgi:hypothetical protein